MVSIEENADFLELANLSLINPGNLEYTISVSGRDSEFIIVDQNTLIITLVNSLDYETQTTLEFTITITSSNGDIRTFDYIIDIDDINESPTLASTLASALN